MSYSQETFNALTLSRLCRFNPAAGLLLYRKMGSATNVVDHSRDIRDVLPDISPKLAKSLADTSDAMRHAETELAFDEKHGIKPIIFSDEDYPERMHECDDAPLVVFYRGTANLNQRRVLSIVGTRHCTAYGQDLIRRFVADLRQLCPETLIVSGLAYGVDINAHRDALREGMETVGVLAHGLDYIYPNAHRDTAREMLSQGGLLTEFFTQTNADKMNFVRRNRIVAGMADAVLLVESAAHGGGLITAEMAQDYGRDVFAFPGNVGAPYSEGCNNAIRDNKAMLTTSADDFVKAMGWEQDSLMAKARRNGIERQLFPSLSAEEQRVVDVLTATNDLQLNVLAVKCGVPISSASATLFALEMKGVLKMYAGGVYHLL